MLQAGRVRRIEEMSEHLTFHFIGQIFASSIESIFVGAEGKNRKCNEMRMILNMFVNRFSLRDSSRILRSLNVCDILFDFIYSHRIYIHHFFNFTP